MTHRPKQHQLEDLSRAKYNLAIPINWVLRDKDKDYGIDAEVEIFDSNGLATGLIYLVQLKATGSDDIKVIKRVDLETSTLKYYEKLDLPVLIVRYSEKEDVFYCKWVYEIDFAKIKQGAKTVRLNFRDEEKWDHKSPQKVMHYLKKLRLVRSGDFSLPVSTFIEINSSFTYEHSHGSLLAGLRKAMQSYPHFVRYEREKDECLLLVKICDRDLIVDLISIAQFTANGINHINDEEFFDKSVQLILFGLAATLIKVGKIEMAANIFLDKTLVDSFFKSNDFLHFYIPILLKTSKYSDVIDAVCKKMDSENSNFLESITTLSMLNVLDINDQNKCFKFQQLLDKSLEKNIVSGLKPAIGVSHYNLGNHYRSRSMMKESILHYLMARKFQGEYLEKYYYYEELAGVLFEMGKYRFSARFYELAIQKGGPESIRPLYADALMLSGQYKLAKDVFQEYFMSVTEVHSEWHLKHYCLNMLIDITGLENQGRLNEKAISAINFSKAGTPSFEDNLMVAINLDALCSDAWFNLGIIKNKSSQKELATFCFLMSGLVNKGDIESWVNATLCSLNQADIDTLWLIVSTAYFFNEEDYLLSLYDELALHPHEMHTLVIDLIETLLRDYKKPNEPRIARVMN